MINSTKKAINDLGLPVTDCRIRVSQRARCAQLKVIGEGYLEAVLPKGWCKSIVVQMIYKHKEWLRSQLKLETQKRLKNPIRFQLLPDIITLAAISETWRIDYQYTHLKNRIDEDSVNSGRQLLVHGSENSHSQQLLRDWLSKKAKSHLLPWFEYVSDITGLAYHRVFFRTQKTRWGSCSQQGNISLNRCLLFLQPELVTYVMVHELCHTRFPNHSTQFWDFVQRFIANYKAIDQQLDDAGEIPPLWVFKPPG